MKAVRVLGRKVGAAQSYRDAAWRAGKPSRRWYSLARWRAIRAAQLIEEPLCRFCARSHRVVQATVCDHVEPHREDEARFWAGPFQSLCAECHARTKQRQEARHR